MLGGETLFSYCPLFAPREKNPPAAMMGYNLLCSSDILIRSILSYLRICLSTLSLKKGLPVVKCTTSTIAGNRM